jgi:hypothetical protein
MGGMISHEADTGGMLGMIEKMPSSNPVGVTMWQSE